jgi:hypothetical protein
LLMYVNTLVFYGPLFLSKQLLRRVLHIQGILQQSY